MVYRIRFYATLAAILIVVLLAQPVYARRKDIQHELKRSVQEGREFYEEMYYMGAIEKWTYVLKVDPWNEEVKLLIEKALKKYEELTSRLEKAYLLFEEGKLDDARSEFNYVQENSSPKNRELNVLVERGLQAVEDAHRNQHYGELIDEGDHHLNLEEFDNALVSFKEARQFFPEGEIAPQRIALTEQRMVESELAEKIHTLREEGRQFFEDDRLKSSRARWEEVLKVVAGDEEASLFISKIDFKLRERDRLLEMARNYFENGVSLFENRQYENAIDQFENSIAMNYQVKKSRRFIEDSRSAIRKQQERAREVNAQLIAQYLREGIKFYNLNRYRDSLAQLNRGLELDPENTQIREYIVRDIIAMKREEEKAVSLTSPFYKLVENLKLLGVQAYGAGDYQNSIKYWEEILLIFPFNEEARISLARTLGKTDPALQEEILEGMYQDARRLIGLGKKREARAKLELIRKVDPEYRDTKALLTGLDEQEKTQERQQKKVVTEKDRRQAQRLYRKALDFYRREKLEDTTATLREALILDPEYVDAQVLLARSESKLRNLQKARAADSNGAREVEDELKIRIKKHYIEGVTLYMNGLYVEAISEWEEVLRLDPTNESVKTNIERAHKRLEIISTQG
jgi:tetratricopeptide (TPR) repeat protein